MTAAEMDEACRLAEIWSGYKAPDFKGATLVAGDFARALIESQRQLVRAVIELETYKDASGGALDDIAKTCGCPEWDYPGQVVRDVWALKAERDTATARAVAAEQRAEAAEDALDEVNMDAAATDEHITEALPYEDDEGNAFSATECIDAAAHELAVLRKGHAAAITTERARVVEAIAVWHDRQAKNARYAVDCEAHEEFADHIRNTNWAATEEESK